MDALKARLTSMVGQLFSYPTLAGATTRSITGTALFQRADPKTPSGLVRSP
jgi:hypothetical protein